MNIATVMDELATAIEDAFVTNWQRKPQVTGYVPGTIVPPAVIVGFPEDTTFDLTFAGGADRLSIPVVLLVSRAFDKDARDRLAYYLDTANEYSLKQVLESHEPVAFDTLRVRSVAIETLELGAVTYLAATLDVDIVG